ncbi:MAG: hypothetical protein LBJ45_01695, partial [Holosporaceae bacterium]|nr:hypothetical protein [Holosporaceae bacterium]
PGADSLSGTGGYGGGLSSLGHISESHNGHNLEIELVGFNQEQFNQELRQIKETVFQKAVTEGATPEIAHEIVEDFEEEISELMQEAEELQQPTEEAPISPVQSMEAPIAIPTETTEGSSDQQSRLESADFMLRMAHTDPLAPQTQTEAEIMSAFHEISMSSVELTPQEKVLAYEPKNAYETKVKDLTIFKHKVLDFMNRHPEAAEMGMKLLSGIARGWQAIKYAGTAIGGFVGGATGGSVVPGIGTMGGGIVGATTAVSGLYATQTATEVAIDATVTSTSNAIATQITSDKVLQNEFASTIKICELGLLCAGSAKAIKALNGTLKAQTTISTMPRVHLNSNQYVGECKLYEIYRRSDRTPMKIGETARGCNSNGNLIRAQTQCNAFEKQFTGEEFEYRILGTYGSKAEVRAAETRTILERRAIDPNALPLNKGIH